MQTVQSKAPIKTQWVRWVQAAGLAIAAACIAGCGGGGGSSGGGSTPVTPAGGNQVALTVNAGVANVVNIPTVSVTVCPPGSTSNCQTINNIQVDTGSYGLRVVSSALTSSLSGALPVTTVSGAQIAECAQFAIGYTWGTVRTANVTIGSETASSIPVQIIGDLASSTVPATGCANGPAQNTASALGANGILGIGVAPNDCGTTCATSANSSIYYSCPSGTNCTKTTLPTTQQVANPVQNFPVDNNGVVLQMPSISSTGATSASGTLTFGIGTQANNTLTASQTFTTNSAGNMVSSTFNGSTVTAFLDSGSNAYFLSDQTLTQCTNSNYSGFYCPSTPTSRTATLVGVNGTVGTVTMNVTSAATLFGNTSNYAFNDLAAAGGLGQLDLGLPFFYGRTIFFGMDRRATGGAAPYVAF
ncbi:MULTISPECIES: DUF3443 domain-containing protein [Paraburkholderia]|uniref:DUF3443 domain-containing protein n=1 Tax=Paraburkholderia megapolitana TaxID=420953 RepID=A0A1I3SE44_9BURK|nr:MULTISPECIES: DUF3443 domain-containing protein [Paraburkholderia]MCX4164755.1 DUF3443 domain-containing protein [Paraburkholderia megapolitana]MDN7160248.1 DUF3443 domain-containing protein [Paraburkholderia sp. CHISQ3]MDQ6497295.1 DUF3443 domain-containing protein [Paraburkholderia megapolitana]QDQ85741.1 DUF3443 domain-containing protein [Paraburkholderia megapolitana]SFJ57015.1 Protein of unknown function [Paraburkholderia megapolitana]